MAGQMPDDAGAVLVIGPSWVGDMVMAQPLVDLLRRRQDTAAVDILAPAWSAPLIHRMPGVRRALDAPFRHGQLGLSARHRLGRELRRERYRQAIVLPNSFKSALVARFARIPLRTGWRGEWRYPLLNDCRVLDEARYPLMVQRFAALAQAPDEPLPDPLPVPRLLADARGVEEALRVHRLDRDRPVLALCPGAEFGEAKQWPAEHHAELAAGRIRDGWQVWLFGSANDRPIADSIRDRLSAEERVLCHNLTGRTSLAQAIDLLSVADAVVSNDSGLMHVAAALRRPLVALFGSTSWSFTPPMSEPVAMLATDIDCRPCFQRSCPLGHRHCLVRLSPDDVSRYLDTVLTGQNPREVTLPMAPAGAG